MSEISIDELRKRASEQKVDSRAGLSEDPLQATLRRQAEEEKAKQKADLEAYNELRARDGREYEYEVAGFNIGDSIMRRAHTLDDNARAMQQSLSDDMIEKEISDVNENTEEKEDETMSFEDNNESNEFDDIVEADVEQEPLFEKENKEPTKVVPITEHAKKVDNEDLPSQSDLDIDDEDLLDISEENTSNEVTDEEMDELKKQIKEKLSGNNGTTGFTVVSKAVSLNAALAECTNSQNAVDWPLLSAGRNITMRPFSGAEIDSLNKGNSGRNSFNTLKDIYRTIYDHIISEKPDFEQWLKVTSFMDLDHIYMAIYKASFLGANYIPYNCTSETCNHVFLSDNIDIMDMCKFKDEAAKKRFMDIYENSDTISAEDSKLYKTTIVQVSPKIAIGFREPSIYNTVFENSILDQAFINKYTKLLTMMVYIDNIYIIKDGQAMPIAYKVDKQSAAKTAKYRIATYAKIIKTLSSDAYNSVIATIAAINDLGDSVQYVIPEYTCPKCHHTISEEVRPALQLLFSRHQLNLLSQQ